MREDVDGAARLTVGVDSEHGHAGALQLGSPLKPGHLAQPDLFIAAVGDAPFRDQLDLMSVPIVGLAKTPRTEPIRFKRGDLSVEVSAPSHIGIATIYDFDLVLWAISQINEVLNRGEKASPTIRAPAYDILRAIKRGTSGREYQRLKEALDRLKATTIRTTIRAKGKRGETFSLLEHVQWAEDEFGKPKGVAVTVPNWLYQAILDRRVLALDPRYFDLTSGLARWLYRCARKQAGDRPDGWRWRIAELHERSGVARPLRSFGTDLRRLVRANQIPEYWFSVYADTSGAECVHVVRRSKLEHGHEGRELRLRMGRHDPV